MTPYKFNGDATQQPQERVQQSQAKTRDRPSRVVRWIMKKTSKAWKGRVEKKTCLISLFCLVRNGDSNTFGFGLKGSIGHSLIGIYDRVWLLAPVQGDNLSLVFLITYHPSYQWV